MHRKRIYTYQINITSVSNEIENYYFKHIQDLHAKAEEVFQQLYILYDQDKDFVSLRTLQRHMKKIPINDFHVYKCQKSVVTIFKFLEEDVPIN
jgi:hypothetical protein